MKRVAGTLSLAGILVGVTVGVAQAQLVGVTAAAATADRAAITGCDPSPAWTLSYTETTGGTVTAVTVSGINAACNGATLHLRLVSGSTVTGNGPAVTVAGGAATVTLTTQPAYSAVTNADIAVVGP